MHKVTLTIEPLEPGMLEKLADFNEWPQNAAQHLLQSMLYNNDFLCSCGSLLVPDADGEDSCPFCMSGCFDDDELTLAQLHEAERQTLIATLVALDKAFLEGNLHTWQFTKALGDYEP